jgi:Uncharacterized protein conserved in bacteria, COG1376
MLFITCFREKQKMFYATVGLLVLVMTVGFFAYLDYLDDRELADKGGKTVEPPQGEVSLIIDVNKRTLAILNDGIPFKQYKVAIGKSESPTPVGEWKVVWKDYHWGTGFGSRWMGLNVPWGIYGIHGTNKPWSIGRYASHGCIRMHNRSVEELFEWVPVGTVVKINGPAVKVKRNLKLNMSGPDVVVVQKKLRDLGLYTGRADGILGPSTTEAINLFQEKSGLAVTGVIDKETRKVLGFTE